MPALPRLHATPRLGMEGPGRLRGWKVDPSTVSRGGGTWAVGAAPCGRTGGTASGGCTASFQGGGGRTAHWAGPFDMRLPRPKGGPMPPRPREGLSVAAAVAIIIAIPITDPVPWPEHPSDDKVDNARSCSKSCKRSPATPPHANCTTASGAGCRESASVPCTATSSSFAAAARRAGWRAPARHDSTPTRGPTITCAVSGAGVWPTCPDHPPN